jgi:hypothetical protein
MSEEQLETVGITKAHELRRLVAQGGNLQAILFESQSSDPCPGEEKSVVRIMDYAADPKVTAKQLRVKINEVLHVHEDVQGLWYDPQGFYATPDERKEIDQFWQWGKTFLQIKDEQPEHVWKKEVFLAAVRECLGAWAEVAND